jgi:hypothetical protein
MSKQQAKRFVAIVKGFETQAKRFDDAREYTEQMASLAPGRLGRTAIPRSDRIDPRHFRGL